MKIRDNGIPPPLKAHPIRTAGELEDRANEINVRYGGDLKELFIQIAKGFSPFPEKVYIKQPHTGGDAPPVSRIRGDGVGIGGSNGWCWILTPAEVYVMIQHRETFLPIWQSRKEAPPTWFMEHWKSASSIPPCYRHENPPGFPQYNGPEPEEIKSSLSRIHARFGDEYRDLFLLAAQGIQDFPSLSYIKSVPSDRKIGSPVKFSEDGIDFGSTGENWHWGTQSYVFSCRGLEKILVVAHHTPLYVLQSAEPAPTLMYSKLSLQITERLKEELSRQ